MIAKHIVRGSIRAYQLFLSPLLGNHCRFYPSCSQYAMEAVEHHGVLRGSWLGIRRLLRCQSLASGRCRSCTACKSVARARCADVPFNLF